MAKTRLDYEFNGGFSQMTAKTRRIFPGVGDVWLQRLGRRPACRAKSTAKTGFRVNRTHLEAKHQILTWAAGPSRSKHFPPQGVVVSASVLDQHDGSSPTKCAGSRLNRRRSGA